MPEKNRKFKVMDVRKNMASLGNCQYDRLSWDIISVGRSDPYEWNHSRMIPRSMQHVRGC